eukprot:COSAG02_NODE_1378_length_12990_cov_3.643705_9_plen_131_part_00
MAVGLFLKKQLTDYQEAVEAVAAAQCRRESAREQAARDAKAAAPKIAFVVLEFTGKELHITTLSPLHTVDELKQAVVVATGAKVEQLQLVLKQKLLDDGRMTLGDCGVVAGSTVNLVLKSADVEEAVPFP